MIFGLIASLPAAGDRQDALPDEAGGRAEERGVHPAEPAPPRRGQPGAHVRDPGADLRGHGEAQGGHAGDDPVLGAGKALREDHQVRSQVKSRGSPPQRPWQR